MLTKSERKRLAREARKLAMECVEGGPEMWNDWCGCAVGTALKRARLLPDGFGQRCIIGAHVEEFLAPGGGLILTEATRERAYRNNPTAVVFPLLALATALDGKVL